MVTLVVAGVVISLAIINLGMGEAETLRREAQAVSILIEGVYDESVTRGERIVLSFENEGYRFYREDKISKKWIPVKDDPYLEEAILPVGIKVLRLSIDGVEVPGARKLIFSPSGHNAPFFLDLNLGKSVARISCNVIGRTQITWPA